MVDGEKKPGFRRGAKRLRPHWPRWLGLVVLPVLTWAAIIGLVVAWLAFRGAASR